MDRSGKSLTLNKTDKYLNHESSLRFGIKIQSSEELYSRYFTSHRRHPTGSSQLLQGMKRGILPTEFGDDEVNIQEGAIPSAADPIFYQNRNQINSAVVENLRQKHRMKAEQRERIKKLDDLRRRKPKVQINDDYVFPPDSNLYGGDGSRNRDQMKIDSLSLGKSSSIMPIKRAQKGGSMSMSGPHGSGSKTPKSMVMFMNNSKYLGAVKY
jgi:hypothetical protein